MLETFRNAWRIPEIRKKILYTLMILLIYRIGVVILPVPGMNLDYIQQQVDQYQMLGFLNMLTGGGLGNFTIFAMGISPYITASIVIQLLTFAIPSLERLAKEGGEEGKQKIQNITRYFGIGMAVIQSLGITYSLRGGLLDQSVLTYAAIVLSMTAGTAIVMWMADQITDKGIGNGMSLIIFIGIVASLPWYFVSIMQQIFDRTLSTWVLVPLVVFMVVIVAGVVFVDSGERRVPVQYAKRVVGRKMYGGNSTHIPMKLNSSGVLPIIFAMTFLQFPGMIAGFWPESGFSLWWGKYMSATSPAYLIIQFALIIAFSFFYNSVSFNAVEVSKNIQQNGGFIPGIRPGKPTSDYLQRISTRMTFFGGVFLAMLATVPPLILQLIQQQMALQATGILICVSVSLETTRQLEAQMLMRHYKGFLK